MVLSFIQSPIQTGYYGRLLVPLLSPARANATWILCDDDVLFGRRFFENMQRVVREGHVGVRNGRFIRKDLNEHISAATFHGTNSWKTTVQVRVHTFPSTLAPPRATILTSMHTHTDASTRVLTAAGDI